MQTTAIKATRRTYSTSEAPSSSLIHDDNRLFTTSKRTIMLPHSFQAQTGRTARQCRADDSDSTPPSNARPFLFVGTEAPSLSRGKEVVLRRANLLAR